MTELASIPKGGIFTVTSGEYSDYTVHGVFRAVEHLDTEVLCREYLDAYPEQKSHFCFSEGEFLAWLARKGVIEDIPCHEWHLGDYGSAMCVTQMKREI